MKFDLHMHTRNAHCQDRPEVAYVTPAALRAGHAQEITLHGRNLQGVTGLLADIPLDARLLKRSSDQVTLHVRASKDAWLGIHQLRALTSDTVLLPRLFVLDEFPLTPQASDNHSPGQAQPIKLPTTVVGQTSKGKIDYYRFKVEASAALTIEVVARRLGTGPANKLGGDETGRQLTIDPVVRILNSVGRELTVVDDTPGLLADVRFQHRFDKPGDYLIAIHDVQFHGGPDHQYVLRLGDFPDIAACFPAAGPPDTIRTRVKLFGVNGSQAFDPEDVNAAAEDLDGVNWLSARGPTSLHSLAVPYLPGRRAETPAASPNNLPRMSLPAAYEGRLQEPGDVHRFGLKLEKGQRVRITIGARTLGSTIWSAMRVLGPDAKLIAGTSEEGTGVAEVAATDPRLDPPPLTLTASTDGVHTIEVFRRLGRAGPAAVYRLEIEPFAGTFTLRPKADFIAVPRGGTAVLAVDVQREEYSGPVDVSTVTTLRGVHSAISKVPGSQVTQALVTLTVPANASELAGWFAVTGRALIGGRDVCRYGDLTSLYDAPPGLRPNQGHFFFLRPLPHVVTRRIALLVTEPAPFSLELSDQIPVATPGAAVTFPITCRRYKGFKGPITLRVDGIPDRPKSDLPAIASNTDRAEIALKIPGSLAAGVYTIVVIGDATAQGNRWTNAAGPVSLKVKGSSRRDAAK